MGNRFVDSGFDAPPVAVWAESMEDLITLSFASAMVPAVGVGVKMVDKEVSGSRNGSINMWRELQRSADRISFSHQHTT